MQAPLCVQDVKSIITHGVVGAWRIIIDSRCCMSNRCDSAIQESDLSEDLVVPARDDRVYASCVIIIIIYSSTLLS